MNYCRQRVVLFLMLSLPFGILSDFDARLDSVDDCHRDMTQDFVRFKERLDDDRILCCIVAAGHDCIRRAVQSCEPGRDNNLIISSAEDLINHNYNGICRSYRYHGSLMPLKCRLVLQKGTTIAIIVGCISVSLFLVIATLSGIIFLYRRRLTQTATTQ